MDSRGEESRKVHHGGVIPGADYPVRNAPKSPASTILASSYADIPVVVDFGLLVATPFFGGSTGWTFLAAAILAAALVIPFIRHKGSCAEWCSVHEVESL
jgi:hypothetical protein